MKKEERRGWISWLVISSASQAVSLAGGLEGHLASLAGKWLKQFGGGVCCVCVCVCACVRVCGRVIGESDLGEAEGETVWVLECWETGLITRNCVKMSGRCFFIICAL